MPRVRLKVMAKPSREVSRSAEDRKPKMPRPALLDLCRDVLNAPRLREAALRLSDHVDEMPHWTMRTLPDGRKARRRGYWRSFLRKLSDSLQVGRAAFPIFNLDGNAKLPFVTFSTLPIFTCPGMGECGRWCYSLRSWRCAGAFGRQLQNTLLLKHRKKVVANAFLTLPKTVVLRLYVDGDFDSPETFWFWMRLLRSRKDLKAYGYSKAWDLIYAQRECVPSNYVLNLSSGGRKQSVDSEAMLRLPFVRGWFKAVKTGWRPPSKGNPGFKRYLDPLYHKAVEAAAPGAMSCPGQCGDCHACGDLTKRGLTIAIGRH